MNTETLLLVLVSLLTLNFLIMGIFITLLLKDLRSTVRRANSILDDAQAVTGVVSKPVGILMGIAASLLEGVKAVKSIRKEDE